MRAMPFLQIVNGKYRVRIVVPLELRPYLPPPHTGKANLTRALGTRNEREANRLAVPWIADFQAAVTSAASITENPHGYELRAPCPPPTRWRPGGVGWRDCGSLIRSSILDGRRCSVKGRLSEGNRRKYTEFEVYRP